jgi:membrane protein
MGTLIAKVRKRIAEVQSRLERLLVWRAWERMLEIEFVDRGVALASKAFVSFFPLVIVVASFMPVRIRHSILGTVTVRLGIRGAALTTAKAAFASTDDVRKATGVLGLVMTIFFATSFTTALQRVYLRAWRRPTHAGVGAYWRGTTWLATVLMVAAVLGGLRSLLAGGLGFGLFAILSISTTSCLWWFTTWFFLMGEVRPRVLVPTAVITSIAMTGFALSATIWMPGVVTRDQAQFGFFGVALALVTWFSGAATCVLVGACAGPVLAEDPGRVGTFIRGGDDAILTPGAAPPLPPPTRELTLRDAFTTSEDL